MPERRRAQHRKSRRGCLQCKQRHTKCDETRPECVNCTVVGRQCKYAEVQINPRASTRWQSTLLEGTDRAPTQVVAASPGIEQASPASTVANGAFSAGAATPVSPALSHYSAPSRLTHPSPGLLRNQENIAAATFANNNVENASLPPVHGAGTSTGDDVNINHMELLIHFSLSKGATATSSELNDDLIELGTSLILQKSICNTCLLYQVLAISARHLSFQRPERHSFYAQQAIQLQTKAIEIFNTTQTFDESNCEAMLLFSSLLNRQVLADALSNCEGDFAAFLDRLIQAILLQRGIRVVSGKTWALLLKSDLSPLLNWGAMESFNQPPSGKECEVLRQLIALSPTLDAVSKEACRSAAHFLQIGFDDMREQTNSYMTYNMIFSWAVLLPKEFATLLTQRTPEAVAILGFYAVLLHFGRNHWVVGDSGAFIIRELSEYLGVEWAHWLEWPLQQLSKTRVP